MLSVNTTTTTIEFFVVRRRRLHRVQRIQFKPPLRITDETRRGSSRSIVSFILRFTESEMGLIIVAASASASAALHSASFETRLVGS